MSLIQREGRPKLDISPEDSLPNTAGWTEHFGNVGMNKLNHPVPLRNGGPAPDGWGHEMYDVNQDQEIGGE